MRESDSDQSRTISSEGDRRWHLQDLEKGWLNLGAYRSQVSLRYEAEKTFPLPSM